MGTTDNFDVPAKGSFVLADQVPIKDSVTVRGAYALGSEMLSGLAAAVQVTAGATTLAVTQALHGERTMALANTAPIAITLPASSGSGSEYRFQVQAVATATSSTIKVANATDVMQGVSWCLTTSSANVIGYGTSATSDTISLNGTTTGGVVGDIIELADVKTGFWSVRMFSSPTGSTATPFSATVS